MYKKNNWTVEHAIRHYRVKNWGLGLVDINAAGNVAIKAHAGEIDLYQLTLALREHGISLPVLVRFPHILQELLSTLSQAFSDAIKHYDYQGNYIAAYPIKVNQQATVIEHFQQQAQWPIAFEVGSKAELLACLGITQSQRQIICNGYKDEAYIRLALIGGLLGHEVVIVLESLLEFQHVLRLADELKATPTLGMRIRLSAIAEGNWQNTGGKRSKFGLTSNKVLELVQELKHHHVTAWMQMLHFHMGSQIPALQHIRAGVVEGMRYFAELNELGVGLSQLNIGGGLGVDYEGNNSSSYFSINYSIEDYANTIIEVVNGICQEKDIQAPVIFSENGRVMTAYHAVLLTNVIDAEYQQMNVKVEGGCSTDPYLKPLINLSKSITANAHGKKDIETYYDQLVEIMHDLGGKFSCGDISLIKKAQSEKLYNFICQQLLSHEKALSENNSSKLETIFIDKYFCNFSLFQSTPDVWGLDQIFPILPLHRLNEMPQQKVRLHDLTCDSDGQIDRYVEAEGICSYLSLHEYRPQEDYVLGLFLVGAYQEILGDLHNLFGDTNAVNIELKSDGGYQICEEEPGDTVEEVLSYVHIDVKKMRQNWLGKVEHMKISGKMKNLILQELEISLQASSYLTDRC